MSWVEVRLQIPEKILDEISGYIFAMGCEGINMADDGIHAYFNSRNWTEETKIAITGFVQGVYPEFMSKDLKVIAVAEQDWNASWKEGFKPLPLTDRIIVLPPWDTQSPLRQEINVIINPQMAFGTGHHETTQLMVSALEKWLQPGMTVFDVGTGSGILALIARMLGAGNTIGIDNDPVAIANADENVGLNPMDNPPVFAVAALEDFAAQEFDLVLANINKNVLLEYAQHFGAYVRPGGILVLSGLLLQDEAQVTQAYQGRGFKLEERVSRREWLNLTFSWPGDNDD
jgi:ribosomal protein L11 methyltransferase